MSTKKSATNKITSTAKKNTQNNKVSTNKGKNKDSGLKDKKTEKMSTNLLYEIKSFIILFSGIFLAYILISSNSGLLGGSILKFIIMTIGTYGSVFLTIAILTHGIVRLFKYTTFVAYKGCVFIYILTFILIIATSLIDKSLEQYTLTESSFYNMLVHAQSNGGIIGSFISKVLIQLLSGFGSWLLLILITAITFIVIFKKCITELLREQNKKITTSINEKKEIKKITKQQNSHTVNDVEFIPVRNSAKKQDKNTPTIKDCFGLDNEFDLKDTPHPKLINIKTEDSKFRTVSKKGTSKITTTAKPLIYDEFSENTSEDTLDTSNKPLSSNSIIDGEDVFSSSIQITGNALKSELSDDKPTQSTTETRTQNSEYSRMRTSTTYSYPPYELLDNINSTSTVDQKTILANKDHLEQTLKDFGIIATVNEICIGPTITKYELQLQRGTRVNRVVSLADDISMALASQGVRIEAPIPGKSAIGIEVPNKEISMVKFSSIVQSKQFTEHPSPLAVALGTHLSGDDLIMDITKMPHLLIAGQTGSGKSVCVNTIITSILYHSSPEDVKMILIDPKMVELNTYNDTPHLLIPVVTDPKLASQALGWAVRTMNERYETLLEKKVKNIEGYNTKAKLDGSEKMPHIVLIIDELNDLMMVSAKQVENSICMLAQKARAAGIHLILATQRPSVDVITGVIKANIPSRIAFAVASQIDSRTILGTVGAEKLLGRGDMLYFPAGSSKPTRAQCAYISEEETERIVEYLKDNQTTIYDTDVFEDILTYNEDPLPLNSNSEYADELLPKAMEVAFIKGEISTSQIQSKLKIGYPRARSIMEEMQERGFVSEPDGAKPRKVLISYEEFYKESEPMNEQ